MTKRITVTIAADGSIVAAASGEAGPACLDELAVITELCDSAVVVESKLTPEYYAPVYLETSTANRQQQTVSDE